MKTTSNFISMKNNNEKITMMTAYDFPTAKFAEEAGMDMILVGDSLGMVVLGYDTTVFVTINDMVHHGKAVRRGAKDTFLVVDMPFGTFHTTLDQALTNAIQLMQQTGAQAVKLEGADDVLPVIEKLTFAGIPVIAHLGLLPQSAGVLGGYKVQGKTAAAAEKLIEDAKLCEKAGACAVVLECIPHQLTEQISKSLTIPTIGIGAGPAADGQVLVFHDMVKYGTHHIPKFVKEYANVGEPILEGIKQYVEEVKSGIFPTLEHSFTMKEEQLSALYGGNHANSTNDK
ncbi:ketopantoate hydroxymethyltransferase [Paenisporosarcina quisquiliarum]|uniref:3-methyl-2-oxobutanoate hydroxymethyltransferase n=1 Tax=Psychrobacillus psychrodurans TaxID=126157 RepID=UPI0008D443F9|nr:3-methyl-2-oxobutanoate hydroxymethyltransferase [Psychrobacillus psychrodurans]MCZ8540080.1 3-methyl-2-oxobutanoate hydroxymethyltransferase [Psychrobacillus psychrodurans]SEM08131.1 ketopantoate hydroxymethyltransferase [Paenisporosarcina quisquiliarum]SFM50536.1 3-methyl-2-oxobutanoate hydroxymethyltransferase [Psychrobacillus psychrodurans]